MSTELTVQDRCDKCFVASAIIRTGIMTGEEDSLSVMELDFCKHHFEELESHLTRIGWEIMVDNRGALV